MFWDASWLMRMVRRSCLLSVPTSFPDIPASLPAWVMYWPKSLTLSFPFSTFSPSNTIVSLIPVAAAMAPSMSPVHRVIACEVSSTASWLVTIAPVLLSIRAVPRTAFLALSDQAVVNGARALAAWSAPLASMVKPLARSPTASVARWLRVAASFK